jgi:hypothetical protein
MRPDLPVLFVSGYTSAAIGDDGNFLPKPFQPTELARRVREILDGDART